MSLLSRPLALHDVEDVEGFVNGLLDDELRRMGGAWLDHHKREEAIAFLIATVFELSRAYDPARSLSFSTYAYRIARMRVTDFYRASMGDRRYGKDVKTLSLDVDTNDEDQREVIAAEVERQMLNLNLSFLLPYAKKTLRRIVFPRWVLGFTYTEIREATNWTHTVIKEREACCLVDLGFTVHEAMA